MRFLILALALSLLVLALLGWYSGYAKEAQGELRCEGAGAVVINVDGKDYAVNGMPVRVTLQLSGSGIATHPEANIDRILTHGLTICDW